MLIRKEKLSISIQNYAKINCEVDEERERL